MPWKGVFNADKKMNKKIALAILAAFFLQAIGILPAVGIDLTAIKLASVSVFTFLLVIGSIWIMYGMWKMKIGGAS